MKTLAKNFRLIVGP